VPFFSVPVKIEWEDLADGAVDSSLATLFVVCFTVALWVTPNPERMVVGRVSPYDQSQSGIIASISDAPFRLQVTEGQERETVEFLLDGNTEGGTQASNRLQSHGRVSLCRRQERRSSRFRRAAAGLKAR